jgi:hypothetical protein
MPALARPWRAGEASPEERRQARAGERPVLRKRQPASAEEAAAGVGEGGGRRLGESKLRRGK